MPGPSDERAFASAVHRIDALLRERRAADASAALAPLLDAHADRKEVWLLRARTDQQRSDLPAMLTAARRAHQIAPADPTAGFVLAEAMLVNGQIAASQALLTEMEARASGDRQVWRRLGEFHAQAGRHHAVEQCARRILALDPHDTNARYALASARIALGRLEEAERLLDAAIAANPQEGDAYYTRSTVRRQTPERNHVAAIEAALQGSLRPAAVVPLCYALAKEREDLGEYGRAFEALERGARARRAQLSYRVETDEVAIARIIETFDARWSEQALAGCEDEGALFVVGLPRSGTTLVDRILSRHSAVASAGELNDWPFAVTRIAGPAADKLELIERSSRLDFANLGREYLRALREHVPNAPRFVIDKTPLNLLYTGLICRALPRARIVHVRRHPVASCFAMYKTLFRMGYPFSYDFEDLARYYAAYDRLMQHWRGLFPDRLIDVHYERLVDDQEGESRRLIESLGLPWEDACLRFHEHPDSVGTASAVQVRQPLYRHARDLWRHYEPQLTPLTARLAQLGVHLP